MTTKTSTTVVYGWSTSKSSMIALKKQRRHSFWIRNSVSRTRRFKSIEHPSSSSSIGMCSSSNTGSFTPINDLHTGLTEAVQDEDFMQAENIANVLASKIYVGYNTMSAQQQSVLRKRMTWVGQRSVSWLNQRLEELDYIFPTTIQIHTMECVNAVLEQDTSSIMNELKDDDIDSNDDDISLEQRIRVQNKDMGVVLSGSTGSGKTLAYAVPLLSTLSDSLFTRMRLRVSGDDDSIDETAADLAERLMIGNDAIGKKKENSIVGSIDDATTSSSSLGRSGTEVRAPLALIVVPTRELGIQIAMQLYTLVGGTIRNGIATNSEANKITDGSSVVDINTLLSSGGISAAAAASAASTTTSSSGGRKVMNKYKGPKGVRIASVLDDEEAKFGLKLQTDIAITTPKYLTKLISDNDIDPSFLRVVVFDEADLVLERTNPADLEKVFATSSESSEREFSRLTLLAGATVTRALGDLAVATNVLPADDSYIATATGYAPLDASTSDSDSKTDLTGKLALSIQDLDVCLYPGLQHECAIVEQSSLLTLTRLLRQELQNYDAAMSDDAVFDGNDDDGADDDDGDTGDVEHERPRVMVFFPDELSAKAAIEPLRDALWGDYQLGVMLPELGVDPLGILRKFKDGNLSVLLATPNSVRGLDCAGLTHVYTLYLPFDDPREYLHLAGRVGRVGHQSTGHVVSIIKDDEYTKMNELSNRLGFTFQNITVPTANEVARDADGMLDFQAMNINDLRQSLEDTVNLAGVGSKPSTFTPDTDTYDDEDDDEEIIDDEEKGTTKLEQKKEEQDDDGFR